MFKSFGLKQSIMSKQTQIDMKIKDKKFFTMDSSSPSPKRKARSQRAWVVDSTVIGSP